MKKILTWQVGLGILLLALSVCFYCFHYFVFRNAHEIMSNFFENTAFVFIQILLVTLVLNRLLVVREKKALMHKLNMVIGAFYSEVGMKLMKYFCVFDSCSYDISKELIVRKEWSDKHFDEMRKNIAFYTCPIDPQKGDLIGLKNFLVSKRDFMLRLLENPNLLEHETFTDLLWAVFHLTEELENRTSFADLPKTDYEHIAGDIKRSYALLITEWLMYMKHLKTNYPYLFSLAIRTNPFDPQAAITVK